jgi:hypothetical protein
MPRNVSGTYTLPLPPVVPNTVIQAAWANSTTDDIAQGITDSLDRNGRGGMIAPFRLTDGTVAQPAWAFNAETGTGMYREAPGILSLAVMGVKVGQFAAAGFTGTLAGPFNLSGNVTFTGRGLFADGTLALPAISFTSDPDTGIYKTGVGVLDFAADATKKLSMNSSSVLVSPSPTASAPSLLVFAGNNAGSSGYAIDMLGSGVGTDKVIVRWLNNGYTIERLSITSDNAQILFSVPGPLPMVFTTNNITRLTIAAAGQATFSNDVFGNTFMAAPNFWVGQTTGAAGTVGIQGGLGASSVYWGNTSAGSGQLSLNTGAGLALNLNRIPGSVNYFQMQQSTTGVGLLFSAEGSDTNVVIGYVAKGNGSHNFYSGSTASGLQQFQIQGVAASSRFISVGGSNGANPFITTNTGGIEMRQNVYGTSAAGANPSLANVSTSVWSTLTNELLQFYQLANGSDNRPAEIRWSGGVLYFRVLNDGYSNAVNWLQATGGFGSGISNISFSMSTAGVAGTVVQQMVRSGSNFNVGIGAVGPTYQFNVLGTGQASAAIFDLASTSATNGATIYLGDQGSAGGNGGCIMFGAFPTPTAAGKHFASIKGYITDASNNTAGELRFNTKDTSADTGSTQCLRLTAAKTLLDNRDLPLARDPGPTAGAVFPIGSILVASIAGMNQNSLATVNAATNNMTIFGMGSGANNLVTGGTWRTIGALSSTSNTSLFIRIA